MIYTEKCQPARQNMKHVTRSLRSLTTKLHILAQQADRFAHSPPNFIFWLGRLVFSVSINSHPDNIFISQQPVHIGTPLQFVVDINGDCPCHILKRGNSVYLLYMIIN
jgi:hypothetical protein